MKNQETFSEALGLSDYQINNLSDKCSELSVELSIGSITLKSDIANNLKENFSYNELLMLSTEYIVMVTEKLLHKEVKEFIQ
jgi:hypothetical protein